MRTRAGESAGTAGALNDFGLTRLEYGRIIAAVDRHVDRGLDAREISAVVSRNEGFPEHKVDRALLVRGLLAESQLAAVMVTARQALDLPREVARDWWEK